MIHPLQLLDPLAWFDLAKAVAGGVVTQTGILELV